MEIVLFRFVVLHIVSFRVQREIAVAINAGGTRCRCVVSLIVISSKARNPLPTIAAKSGHIFRCCSGSMFGAEPMRRQWRMKQGGSPVSKGVLRPKKQDDDCELRLRLALNDNGSAASHRCTKKHLIYLPRLHEFLDMPKKTSLHP